MRYPRAVRVCARRVHHFAPLYVMCAQAWELCHKGLGYLLLGLAALAIYTGLVRAKVGMGLGGSRVTRTASVPEPPPHPPDAPTPLTVSPYPDTLVVPHLARRPLSSLASTGTGSFSASWCSPCWRCTDDCTDQ